VCLCRDFDKVPRSTSSIDSEEADELRQRDGRINALKAHNAPSARRII